MKTWLTVPVIVTCVTVYSANPPLHPSSVPGIEVIEGYDAEVFADGLNAPKCLAIEPGGTFIVASDCENPLNCPVVRLAPTGERLASSSVLHDPDGVAVDSRGRIFVTEYDVVTLLGSLDDDPDVVWASGFGNLNDIVVDGNDTLYVIDSDLDCIHRIEPDGTVRRWVDIPEGLSLSVDPGTGELFVSTHDPNTYRVSVDGVVSVLTRVPNIEDVERGRGAFGEELFAARKNTGDIVVLDGAEEDEFSTFARGFKLPFALFFTDDGALLVSDRNAGRIVRIFPLWFTAYDCTLTEKRTVILSWETDEPDIEAIAVLEDEVELVKLPPDATSYEVSDPPLGTHRYRLVATVSGKSAGGPSCVVTIPYFDGLTCEQVAPNTARIAWTNAETYLGILVTRDGEDFTVLSGDTTEFVDDTAPCGRHVYGLAAVQAGAPTGPVESCALDIRPVPVSDLHCDTRGSYVTLHWTNGDTYEAIEVLRDGRVVETPAGSAENCVVCSNAPGGHTFEVRGKAGSISSEPAACSVTVANPLPIENATRCDSGPGVRLFWTNADCYTAIDVLRDGSRIAALGGDALSYLDEEAAGANAYQVVGWVDDFRTEPQTCADAQCAPSTLVVDRSGGGSFTDIQSAIDAAAPGDTVLVKPGEYVIDTPITFLGKPITVRGEHGAKVTTIRMSERPADPDRASVVIFENEEPHDSLFEGFTLTGGRGSLRLESHPSYPWGGGIVCIEGSSPTIRECRITRNIAQNGSAVLIYKSSPRLVDCEFFGNSALAIGEEKEGVCTVGIDRSESVLERCSVFGNFARFGASGLVASSGSVVTAVNCTVFANVGMGTGERRGAGVQARSRSTITLTNCLVVGNVAREGGGGLDCVHGGSRIVLNNCVVWDNTPSDSCGSFDHCLTEQDPLFVNPGVFDFERFTTVSVGGVECPLPDFIIEAPDYRLRGESPAVDAGSPEDAPATDLDGNPRPCGAGVDIGPYELAPRFVRAFTGERLEDGTVRLTWERVEPGPTSLTLLLDGRELATLDPAVTSFELHDPEPGLHLFSLVETVGDKASPALHTELYVPIFDDLVCERTAPGTVRLSWRNTKELLAIILLRDEVEIAVLDPTAGDYTDTGIAAGRYVYGLVALIEGQAPTKSETCVVTLAPAPVTDFACESRGTRAILTWKNGDRYDTIEVLRDGVSLGDLSGDTETYDICPSPPGFHDYVLRGRVGENRTEWVLCTIRTEDPMPVENATVCETGGKAHLAWTNGDCYTRVEILRDDALLKELPGDTTAWVDEDPTGEGPTYAVVGLVGEYESPPVTCRRHCDEIAFARGDVNADGRTNMADAISILGYLFLSAATLPCVDTADANDTGSLNLADAVYLLGYLFAGGTPPPTPFPDCGLDPTTDSIGCESYPPCQNRKT